MREPKGKQATARVKTTPRGVRGGWGACPPPTAPALYFTAAAMNVHPGVDASYGRAGVKAHRAFAAENRKRLCSTGGGNGVLPTRAVLQGARRGCRRGTARIHHVLKRPAKRRAGKTQNEPRRKRRTRNHVAFCTLKRRPPACRSGSRQSAVTVESC